MTEADELRMQVTGLVRVISLLDGELPHEGEGASSDAPKPAWCAMVREALGFPKEECCNVCQEWAEITKITLDKTFKKES